MSEAWLPSTGGIVHRVSAAVWQDGEMHLDGPDRIAGLALREVAVALSEWADEARDRKADEKARWFDYVAGLLRPRGEVGRAVIRSSCRCGVYEYVHLEGRGCGNYRKASRVRVWLQDHELWQHVAAPIWLRLPEKRRWTVVHWLNRSRRRCWSDLVSEALAYREDDPCDVRVPRLRGERALSCASVCDWMHPDHAGSHDCSCYCGKFQFTATDGANDRRAVNRAYTQDRTDGAT